MNYCTMDLPDTVIKKDATTNTNDKCTEKCKTASHVLKSVADMRKDEELCDLILQVGDSQFKVHRLVLCVWSPVVRTLLLQPNVCCQVECQAACHIQIGFSDTGVFEQFVNYLYTGDVPEEAINVPAVLLLAASFKVIQLQQYCEELLKATLNIENMISVHRLATKFSLKDLEIDCLNFLRKHAADIVQTNDFRKLHPGQIDSFLGSESMHELDPEIKLFLIISWVTEEVANRQQFMVVLLSHINWSVVAADFLLEISQTDNFFTCNPSSLYLLLQTLHSSSISLGPYEDQFGDLKTEYSYLLDSVVSSSVELAPTVTPSFQPISVSLSSRNGVRSNNKNKKESGQQGIHENISVTSTGSLNTPPKATITVDRQGVEMSEKAQESHLNKQSTDFLDSVENSPLDSSHFTSDLDNNTELPSRTSHSKDSAKRKKSLQTPKHEPKNTEPPDKLKLRLNWPLTRSAKRKLDELKHESPKKSKPKQKHASENSHSKKQKSPNKKSTNMRMNSNNQEILSKVNESEGVEKKKSGSKTKNLRAKKDKPHPSNPEIIEESKKDLHVKEFSTPQVEPVKEGKADNPGPKENEAKDVDRPWLNDEGNFLLACDLCSFTSKSDLKYYRHMASSHFPGPPHHCDQQDCNFKAPCIKELTKHRTTHGDRRPFVCTKCLQAFRAKSNLYAHMKVHFDVRLYECQVCGKSFKQKCNLDQHMVTHSDLRPYLCDLCGFSTKFQAHLALHKKTHTGDVFHCKFPSCFYSTPKSTTFKAHMRSHLGIRTHVCSTCGKAFLERSHLVRHERIHSSQPWYSCSECSYTSTRLDRLKEHQKKHHTSPQGGQPRTQAKDSSGLGGKEESQGKKKKSAQAVKTTVTERQSVQGAKERKGQVQSSVPKEDLVEVLVMKASNKGKSGSKPTSNPLSQNEDSHKTSFTLNQISNNEDVQKTASGTNNQRQSIDLYAKKIDSVQGASNTHPYPHQHISNQVPNLNLHAEEFFNIYKPQSSNTYPYVQVNRHSQRADVANMSYPDIPNNGSTNYSHPISQNIHIFPEALHGTHIADILPDVMMSPFSAPPPPIQTRDYQDNHSVYFNAETGSNGINVQHMSMERQFMHENSHYIEYSGS